MLDILQALGVIFNTKHVAIGPRIETIPMKRGSTPSAKKDT